MLDRLTTLITEFEGGWFDLTRRVQTGPGPDTPKAGGDSACYKYLPTRPSRVRQVIRSLQIENYGDFTFIDMGSGKGRVLFVAAERPFRSIQGVEYDAGLHRQAEDNIARSSTKLSRIELHNVDASQYEFPSGNLVVYFFNPFGPKIMEAVIANLAASLDRSPRTVFVALVTPESAQVVGGTKRFQLQKQARGYHIYRTTNGD